MNYAQMRNYDIANGPGIRCTLFVSGCHTHCPGCFNPEYQDPNYGKKFDEAAMKQLLTYYMDPDVNGLSILGGEPLEYPDEIAAIIQKCKKADSKKTIWIYTGFVFEDIATNPTIKNIFRNIDVLVDGPYVERFRNPALQFRGSENQRIIDIVHTISNDNNIVLWKGK